MRALTLGAIALLAACSISGPPRPPEHLVRLSWPTVDRTVDGEPLRDLSGYELRYGLGVLNLSHNLGAQATSTALRLPAGEWQFELFARSASGGVSEGSNVVIVQLPPP